MNMFDYLDDMIKDFIKMLWDIIWLRILFLAVVFISSLSIILVALIITTWGALSNIIGLFCFVFLSMFGTFMAAWSTREIFRIKWNKKH